MNTERKRQALGKGLGALIPGGEQAAQHGELASIPPGEIFPNPEQPRRNFDADSLKELADSIQERGILQPVLVRRVPGGYELVAGERRLRAAKMAGLKTIPALVKPFKDKEKLELALIENIQRQNLNPIEEAQAYRELREAHGYTQEDVARRVGKDRATVANALRLLELPDFVREEIVRGTLTSGHARPLLGLGNERATRLLLNRIIKKGLSVREVEAAVSREKKGGDSRRSRAVPSVETQALVRRLERALGARVQIKASGRGGRLEIKFKDLEDLNSVVERILG